MDQKYNLRDAKEDYNLWDNVYNKDAIKSLENSTRWEPGKRERERRLRKQMLAEQNARAALEFNEKDEDKALGGGKCAVPTDVMNYCLEKTHFGEQTVKEWYLSFVKECPTGKLTKVHLHRLFKQVFPVGDSETFCNHIFRVFDDDGNESLDFTEFLMALDVTQCGSERDKLQWAFRLYDVDCSGSINVKEMASIIETMDNVEGRKQGQSVSLNNPALKLPSVQERAEELFKSLDKDGDGEINQEEFVEGYIKMHHTVTGISTWSRQNSLVPTMCVNKKLDFHLANQYN